MTRHLLLAELGGLLGGNSIQLGGWSLWCIIGDLVHIQLLVLGEKTVVGAKDRLRVRLWHHIAAVAALTLVNWDGNELTAFDLFHVLLDA